MAAQTLKTGAGQLYETTTEELAKKAQLPASPITPMGAASIGANPDAVKMAGTKAQKQAAIKDTTQSLSERLRVGPTQAAISEAEREQLKQAQTLGGLTSLSERVSDLKNKALIGVTTQAAPALYDTTKAANNPTLASALTKLNKNPADQTALATAANALGLKSTDLPTLNQALQTNYGANLASQAQQKVSQVLNAATVKQLGFNNLTDLESALRIPAGQAANMDLTQFQDKIQQAIQGEQNTVQNARAVLNNDFAGPAAKAEARAQLRRSGEVGIRTAETDLDQFADEIAGGVKVQFAGKDLTLDEMLDSPEIGNFISTYLVADQKTKEAMTRAEPSLGSLVEKYKTVFADAGKSAETGAKKLAQTQVTKEGIRNLGGGVEIPEELMNNISPGWNRIGGDTAPDITLLKDLKSSPSASPVQKSSVISLLSSANPQLLKQLTTLKFADLVNLGLDNPQGVNAFNKKVETLGSIPNLTNPTGDKIAQYLGFGSESELQKSLGEAQLMKSSGLFGQYDSGLDAIQKSVVLKPNGSIDAVKTLAKLKGTVPAKLDPKSIAAWTNPANFKDKLGDYTSNENEVFSQVKDILPGGITANEYKSNLKDKFNPDNIKTLAPVLAKMDADAKRSLSEDMYQDVISKHFGSDGIQSAQKFMTSPTTNPKDFSTLEANLNNSIDDLRKMADNVPELKSSAEASMKFLANTLKGVEKAAQGKASSTAFDMATSILSSEVPTIERFTNAFKFNKDIWGSPSVINDRAKWLDDKLAEMKKAAKNAKDSGNSILANNLNNLVAVMDNETAKFKKDSAAWVREKTQPIAESLAAASSPKAKESPAEVTATKTAEAKVIAKGINPQSPYGRQLLADELRVSSSSKKFNSPIIR